MVQQDRAQPQTVGAGLLVVLSSVLFLSWAPAVIGLVIMIAGHVIRPTG